jgi:methylsterol monooxygenase
VQKETDILINSDPQVVFNQIFVGIPLTFVMYYLMQHRGLADIRELPTFNRIVLDFAAFLLIEELGFYYSHRLLHHGRIYKFIHKQHHEWTSPIAITALYAHPLEHLASNLLPVAIGPFLMDSHILVTWLWFGMALTNTLHVHSGYHLPFVLSSPEKHDYHHLK